MVGIVTGSGLGLDNSSLQALGAKGLLGNPSEGKAGESVYVNATNGNLVIRDQDEMLLGQGLGAQIFRSYNSQDGQWREGATPTVTGLTGTLNAAGSTVTRTDWDGSTIVYGWDAARGAYVSMVPGAAGQTITGDGTHWALRDDRAKVVESYDVANSGRLVSRSDFDGNATTFQYNAAGLLSKVTTGSQESVTLAYDASNRLTAISSTYANADGSLVTATRTRYGYDAQGRLSTVTVDLSPEDGSITDGNVYTTTYTYDGTSNTITAIQNPDGSSVGFTYTNGLIASIIETTASGVATKTTVTHAVNASTGAVSSAVVIPTSPRLIQSSADGHMLLLSAPAAGLTGTDTYLYDANGRVTRWTDTLGRVTNYTYDAVGNVTRTVDTAGNVVDRTYGAHDELLIERRYTATVTKDASGNAVLGTDPTTTQGVARCVYDAEQHLRFAISAEGRVTEFRYDAAGRQIAKIAYTGAEYPVDPASTTNDATETTLGAWLATIDRSASERTDIQYDFRGQVAFVTTYADTNSDGTGSASGDVLQTRYVYDALGRLIQRYTGTGASVRVENDTYDGLGRLTSTTAADGAVTLYQYSEASRTMVQRFANGLVRTSTYDSADRLMSVEDSGSAGTIARTTYAYDAAGRLASMTDPDGGVHTYVYNARNLKTAEIDPAGRLTIYTYDNAGRVTATLSYATPVDASLRASIASGSASRPAASASDCHTWLFYDLNDHLVKTVDGDGAVTDNVYDATGQLVSIIARATKVNVATLTTTPTLATATVADNASDRVTRLFHDKDGLIVGSLDPEGYLTETHYDAAGQRTDTIAYKTAVDANLRKAVDLASMRPVQDYWDNRNHYVYDHRGLLIAQIDGDRDITTYRYDSYGNVATLTQGGAVNERASPEYQVMVQLRFNANPWSESVDRRPTVYVDGVQVSFYTFLTDGQYADDIWLAPGRDHVITFGKGSGGADATNVSLSGLTLHADPTSGLGPTHWIADPTTIVASTAGTTKVTQYTYDAQGRLLHTTAMQWELPDASTDYVYDTMGRVIETRGPGGATTYRYDLEGHLIAELNGRGVDALDALGTSPSAAQVEAVWSSWATRYTYDAAGLLTSTTDAVGSRTVYFYDADGRLKAQVDALGEVTGRDYDALGNLVRTTVYGQRLSPSLTTALTGGILSPAVATQIAALGGTDASVTTMSYTATGRLAEMDSPLGHFTRYVYDAFGGAIKTQTELNDLGYFTETDVTFDHRGLAVTTVVNAGVTTLNLKTVNIYDAFGRVTSTIDPNGVYRSQSYDHLGHVTMKVSGAVTADGTMESTGFIYNSLGQLIQAYDGLNHTTQYQQWFKQGIHVVAPDGTTTIQELDALGRTISTTDGEGHVTHYTYDSEGHLLTTTDANGTTSTVYDKAGRAVRTTDAAGHVVAYTYDAVGHVLARAVDPDGLNLVTTYTYDARGNVLTTTDPSGRKVANHYDLENRVVSTVVDEGGLGLTTTFAYNATGRVVSKAEGDASGTLRVTQYTYDGAGRLYSTVVDPNGLKLTTRYTHDSAGNVIAVTDATGATSRMVYDGANRVVYTVNPLGAVTHVEYDVAGNMIRRTAYATAIDPSQFATKAPDAATLASKLVSAAGDRVTRYAYDVNNRLRFTQQPDGVVTEQVYDHDDRVVRSGIYTQPGAVGADFSEASVAQAFASIPQRTARYVYDDAGHLAYTIDATGMVTATVYDADGLLVSSTGFASAYTGNPAMALSDLRAWTAQAHSAADRVVRDYHDAIGRTVYTVDAGGYVTSFAYDATGNVVEQHRYDKAVTVGDGATTATVAALVNGDHFVRTAMGYDAAGRLVTRTDGQGVTTQYTLDSLGRSTATTEAAGTSAAAVTQRTYDANDDLLSEGRMGGDALNGGASYLTTQYVYDAMGRRIGTIDPRGVQAADRNNNMVDALATRKALGIVDSAGNGKAGANLTDADIALIRSYYTVSTDYDAAGRAIATHTPYGRLAVGQPTRATVTTAYDVFGDAVKVTDARGGVGYFYFDKAGRVIGQVDPAGHYTQTVRDLFGNAVTINAYAGVSTGIAIDTPPAGAGTLATTTLTYDPSNRLTSTTDAMGGVESYAYDIFGNQTRVTNKLGGITTYAYDNLGRVIRETLPIVTNGKSGGTTPVINAYEYDSRGNRTYAYLALGSAEERDTLYQYDQDDRLTATFTSDLSHVGRDGSGDGMGAVVEVRNYDARGNLTSVSKGAASDFVRGAALPGTYYYYDQANRLTGQVNADGAYVHYQYDAAGNKVKSLAYIAPVTNIGGVTPPTSPTPFARETDYTYDAANRLIAQYQPNVVIAQAVGGASTNANFSTSTGISQSWTYDASGELVSHTDGAGHVNRTWYDKLGHAILSIDANGYVVAWTRDADGNVLTETKYATKYAGDPATITDPLAVSWPTNGSDRLTVYTYDTNGRVLTQAVKGVSYGAVDGNGHLTQATGDATTTYAYDAAGNLLRQTDANGSLFSYSYDQAGRKLSESSPSFTDYAGHVVQVTTSYVYNAHNEVLRETRSGGPTNADEVNSYQYDDQGNLVSKTNAAGIITTMTYDALGNLIRMSNPLTDASGTKRDQVVTITYDVMNREVSRVTTVGGAAGVTRNTRYDVFGEVTGRGINGVYQETTDYDLAGRVLRTNADQGRMKIYLYDGNSNATIAIESQSSDLSRISVLQVSGQTNTDAIFGTPGLAWTMTVYDGTNQVVDVIQPTMDLSTAHLDLQAVQVPGGAPGQIGVSVGGPVDRPTHLPGADANHPLYATPGASATGTIEGSGFISSVWTDQWMTGNFVVTIPDLSAVVGAYSIRVVTQGGQDFTVDGNPKTITWTRDYPPQSSFPVQLSESANFYLINRSTGQQLADPIGEYIGQGAYFDSRDQIPDQTAWDSWWPMSGVSSTPKINLSPMDSGLFNGGAATYQIYLRTWGTNQPYSRNVPSSGTPASLDIGFLPSSGQFEILLVSQRPDGSVVRTERYMLTMGPTPQLSAPIPLTAGVPLGVQVSGAGTFIMAAGALVAVDMTTATGGRGTYGEFAYRPWGSSGAYSWAGGSAIAPGSTSISTAGIPDGDYEIVFYMVDGTGNIQQQLNGRMVKNQQNPSISLAYPATTGDITLSNVPPGATSASIVFTNTLNPSQKFTTGNLVITTPGNLVWTMPQDMVTVSGALTQWKMDITFTDGREQPPMSYAASGTISVGTQRPQVPFGVNVQTSNLFTLSFTPAAPNGTALTAGQYMVLRFWPKDVDISTNPGAIQRRVIQKNPFGQYVWDSLDLNPAIVYAYEYDIYATQAETQNAGNATSLVRNSGVFTPKNSPTNQEAHWIIRNISDSHVTVHRKQSWDAFGDIVSETDGNGNTTNLAYNTLGKLTTRTEAAVTITYGNGYQALVRPTTQYLYDRIGRQVGMIDANGNVTTQTWNDALDKVSMEFHADGGVVSHQYDALGNERVRITALGAGLLGAASARRTDYAYDALNRLIRADGPVINGQRAFDTYTYDEMDRRISHTNVLGTDTVAFDVEGNVSAVTSAAGRTTTYTTVWNGAANGGQGTWVQTTTLPFDMNSAYAEDHVEHNVVDARNSFGQALSHVDAGGHVINYSYDFNGLLKQQGNSSYTYYNNGLLKSIIDTVTGINEQFEYDNNGNVTLDSLTNKNANWAFQQSVSVYDALNRLVKVTDPRYQIAYEYDAVGNRIHMNSVYTDGLGNTNQTQDYWYEYDMMNRFTVTMGQLAGGVRGTSATDTNAHVTAGTSGDGVSIGYDAFGQRVSATYAYDNHNERYDYDAGGYLTLTTIRDASGSVTGTAMRTNDLAGRVTHYVETSGGQNVQDTTHVYDADSLVLKDIDNVATAKLGHESGTVTDRLADGTVKATHTYGDATTVTTTYTYVWFDSEKQSEIKVQASNQSVASWSPGLSAFNYDSEGRLVSAVDVAGSRAFNYQVDAEGRILQRDELIGVVMTDDHVITSATSNRSHSYYYMDGNQIGNVGSDGPERIDYAQELAQHMQQTANKDDSHKRYTPVAFADFDANYQPINSSYPGTAPTSYIVHSGDTLPGIAQAIWGDSSLWWMLADANNLTLDTPLTPNTVLTVPNKVTNIHNNSTTVRPYDPGIAIGDTQPTLPEAPPPPAPKHGGGGGCGGLLQVVAIVVAVVATIYTAGAAAGLLATAFGTSATALGTVVAAGAVAGAVGSIAGQGVLIAGGAQSGINWKGVALGAVGGAVAAGVGEISVGGGNTLAQVGSRSVGGALIEGAATAAGTSVADSVLGLGSFSWRDVAAGAVSSGVAHEVGRQTEDWNTSAQQVAKGVASGAASAAVHGNLSQDWQAIEINVVGSTIGNSIADSLQSQQASRDASEKGQANDSLAPIDVGPLDISDDIYGAPQFVVGSPSVVPVGSAYSFDTNGPDISDSTTVHPAVTVGDLEVVAASHYSAADNTFFNATLDAGTQFQRDQADLARVMAHRQADAEQDATLNRQIAEKIQSEGAIFVALQGSLAFGGILGGVATASPALAFALNGYGFQHGVNSAIDGYYSDNKWQFGLGAAEAVASGFGLGVTAKSLLSSDASLAEMAWNPEWANSESGSVRADRGVPTKVPSKVSIPNPSQELSQATPALEGTPFSPDVVNARSAEFYALYGDNPARGTTSTFETRQWYLAEEARIPSQLDSSSSLESQARQAFELRNSARTQARELMSDRITADRLTREEPNRNWDDLVQSRRAAGLTDEQVYQSIIESAQRTRTSVNQQLGL